MNTTTDKDRQPVACPVQQGVGPHFEWEGAPRLTEWGDGMMEATLELSKDETASIYAHKDALPLVDAALRAVLEPRTVVGYMVRSDALETAALYTLSKHAEALDAARRWNASITALVCAPGCPDGA